MKSAPTLKVCTVRPRSRSAAVRPRLIEVFPEPDPRPATTSRGIPTSSSMRCLRMGPARAARVEGPLITLTELIACRARTPTLTPGIEPGKFKVVTTRRILARLEFRHQGHEEIDVAGNQWPLIRAERVALIADLEGVPDEKWSTQSLCADWTVRDVLAHITTTARMTPGKFIARYAGTGFRFNQFNEIGV